MTDTQLHECFEDFQTLRDEELAYALELAMKFCRDMASCEVAPYWLTFLGHSGTGKTMLCKRIIRFFRRHLESLLDENKSDGINTFFYRKGGILEWSKMMERMMDRDFGFMTPACEDWMVALDDIGSEHEKHRELSASKLYSILTSRNGKWTLITANLSLEGINRHLDARIASRLLRDGSTALEITSPDFNLR